MDRQTNNHQQSRFHLIKREAAHLVMLLILSTSLGLLTGCGDGRPGRVKVSGTITIDGKLVENGGIRFFPTAGGRAGGGGLKDGKFNAMMYTVDDGLPTGDYNVAIIANVDVNEFTTRWLIPEKYADDDTSGLAVSITEETDSLNFELTWEGDKHDGPYNVTHRE